MPVDHFPDEVKQGESVMLSDDIIDQAPVPENHHCMLWMNGVSTLKGGIEMSQRLIAE